MAKLVKSIYTGADVTALGEVTPTDFLESDLAFGDSVKATFGASDDLQIFHNGSNSYITDSGTGNLIIQADELLVQNTAGTANYIRCQSSDESVQVRYGGATKLTTTSTGIDVTGTVTADDLTLSSGGVISTTGGLFLDIDSDNNAAAAYFEISHDGQTKKIATFSELGDISFYEDTGTTAKFFWDASAESLGIGTSSPSSLLHVQGNSASGVFQLGTTGGTTNREWKSIVSSSTGYYAIQDATAAANRVTIDTSGNVGIGTSSPSSPLHVNNAASSACRLYLQNTGNTAAGYTQVFSQNDDLVFRSGANAETMRLDSSGNVGIGTSSPSENLHVTDSSGSAAIQISAFGTGNNDATLILDGNGTGLCKIEADKALTFSVDGGSTEAARIDSSGNVGIGNTSPLAWGSGIPTISFKGTYSGNPTRAGAIAFDSQSGTDGGAVLYIDSGNLRFYTDSNDAASATERMRIDSSGNVGIGTSSPSGKLDVNISTNARGYFSSTIGEVGSGNFALQVVDATGAALKPLGFRAEDIRFATGSSERMRIDSSGNVGIGEASPSGKLHVLSPSNARSITLENSVAAGASYIVFRSDDNTEDAYIGNTPSTLGQDTLVMGTGGTERMRIDSSGNVGIGTSTPATKLDVNGSARAATQVASKTGATAPSFSTYQNFVYTLTGNVTLANSTDETVGQTGFFVFIQDATGGRTLSLGSEYKTAGGAGITLSTAANAIDVVPYVVAAANTILLGTPQLGFA